MQNKQSDKKSKVTEIFELFLQLVVWAMVIIGIVWGASSLWDSRYHHLAMVTGEITEIKRKIDSVAVEENHIKQMKLDSIRIEEKRNGRQ